MAERQAQTDQALAELCMATVINFAALLYQHQHGRISGDGDNTQSSQSRGQRQRYTGALHSNSPPLHRFTTPTLQTQPPRRPMEVYALPNANVAIISLSRSAAQGDLQLVRMALAGGSSVHFKNDQGETPLHLAAQGGHVNVVELLLERGASINARDRNQKAALHIAAENGDANLLSLLLQQGADVNLKESGEKTALHWAAQKGNEEVVKALIAADADKEVRMKQFAPHSPCPGGRALHLAVLGGHRAIVSTLLDCGAEIDGEDRWDRITPLDVAVRSGNCEMVKLLLTRGANPNGACKTEDSLLSTASARGDDKILQQLLSSGTNIAVRDADGDPPLHSAAWNGHLSTVELLLKNGADARTRGAGGRTALWYATAGGHEAIVRLLREHGADDTLGPDIKDDSRAPLGKIADGHIFRHIERAQKFMFRESSWSQKLLFLVSREDTNGPSDFDLDLIHPDAESKEPYIAVSYCWSGRHDSSMAAPLRIRVPQKGKPGLFYIREAQANSSVIRRSMEYAASKGVKRIWIDQECIDQNDTSAIQQAIQSMHIVYQQAAHTLVLLDSHVQSPEDIQALPEILNHGMHDDLRDRILGDRWFTRAWTTQEWINSQLEKLSYLVSWKDNVDVDETVWHQVRDRGSRKMQNISRAWELGHDEILDMACMSMRRVEVMKSIIATAPLAGNAPVKSFTHLDAGVEEMEGKTDEPPNQSKHQRLRMTMLAAWDTLDNKRSLLVSDRVAILSNLTHCPYRIDTREAVKNDLSFTACVIATALYNGDLSVLFSQCIPDLLDPHGQKAPETQCKPSWAQSCQSGLRNIIQPFGSRLSLQIRMGDPCLILESRALVKGIFWEIIPFHGFCGLEGVVGAFLWRYSKVFGTKEQGKMGEAGHTLFQLLVEEILFLGRTDILELLLVSVLPRQLSSPTEIFELIDELEQWRRTRREQDWPKRIFEKPAPETINSANTQSLPGARGGLALLFLDEKKPFQRGHPWGNQIIQWIYHAISKGMPLALGQCEINGEKLVSLFMLDPAKHSMVFTPLSELEYEYGCNPWLHFEPKANFWVVESKGEKVRDDLIQGARAELRTLEMYEQNISSDVFKVQNTGNVYGVWSPRLSRAGMWKKKSGGDVCEMHSLGKAASYAWFD